MHIQINRELCEPSRNGLSIMEGYTNDLLNWIESSVDFIHTSLLKLCPSMFSEIIAGLANLSFWRHIFQPCSSPPFQKFSLDPENPANYQLTSNWNNISKIMERLFLSQFFKCHLFSKLQPPYNTLKLISHMAAVCNLVQWLIICYSF